MSLCYSCNTVNHYCLFQKPSLLTTSGGAPVDIRDWTSLNSDFFDNEFFMDSTLTLDAERIPERAVHGKGSGVLGYFEVTNDVSMYTKANVFNGVGKVTPAVVRFSTVGQSLGGTDMVREMKAFAAKLYTNEGNLDFLGINFPVYFYKDPIDFVPFLRCFRRNPSSHLYDMNSRWDFITKKPASMHGLLWTFSDYGLPDSYRKMDNFPVHVYVITNEIGDKYYAKFNFRTEQGLANLTNAQAQALGDLDYYVRDLYNAIEENNFPSWRLDMDIMTLEDLKHVDYDPFDVTLLWKRGDYKTVTIGRLVLNHNTDNHFRYIEQSAFSPSNLVPGIPGPVDFMFKSRRLVYRDTQNYRLGRNHDKIFVNQPIYAKTYNRDGQPPLNENMNDVPNYFPNSFNGPTPFVDESRPKSKLLLLQSNTVDLQPATDFYNEYVKDDAHRDRLASNAVETLENVYPELIDRAVKLFTHIDPDLGRRVSDKVWQQQQQQRVAAASVRKIPRLQKKYKPLLRVPPRS